MTHLKGARLNSVPRNPIRDFLGNDLDWVTSDAACKGRDAALFFGTRGSSAAHAKELCLSCPLLEACRTYALSQPVWGVWGAMTEEERRALHTLKQPWKSRLQPCGTRAAYRRHRAKGETPCPPCKEANAARERERDRKKSIA